MTARGLQAAAAPGSPDYRQGRGWCQMAEAAGVFDVLPETLAVPAAAAITRLGLPGLAK